MDHDTTIILSLKSGLISVSEYLSCLQEGHWYKMKMSLQNPLSLTNPTIIGNPEQMYVDFI